MIRFHSSGFECKLESVDSSPWGQASVTACLCFNTTAMSTTLSHYSIEVMGMVKDGDFLVAIGFDASISVLHTLFTSVRLQALPSPTNPKKHMPGLGRFHPTWYSISIIYHFCITSDYSIGRNWSWLGTTTKRKKMIPFCFRRTSVLFFDTRHCRCWDALRWRI